jgi:hypothetical protein
MLTQTFFVQGAYLGTVSRQAVNKFPYPHTAHSRAWICPVCASVWAVASLPKVKFHFVQQTCPVHTEDTFTIPGSLWSAWESEFNEALTGDVLKREFLCHLNYAETHFV